MSVMSKNEGKKEGCELIQASNTGLVMAPGYNLAIIDESDTVVHKGVFVKQAIFEKLSAEVVKSFCSRFKGFTDEDFKS